MGNVVVCYGLVGVNTFRQGMSVSTKVAMNRTAMADSCPDERNMWESGCDCFIDLRLQRGRRHGICCG